VRFLPRPSDLDPFDARLVARWVAGSETAPARRLSRTQRLSLAALLAEVWEMEHPSVSFCDDPADARVIEHLPDFEPAPTYEWGRARHPESGVLFEWTRADPRAERESTRPIDPYEPMARAEIDEVGDVVRLELDAGLGEAAFVEIREGAIELFGVDDEPPCLVRAIIAFTGWSAPRPSYWGDNGEGVHVVAEIAPCVRCGEVREVGFAYATQCPGCGATKVGLTVRA
jgi:hypothetical protein